MKDALGWVGPIVRIVQGYAGQNVRHFWRCLGVNWEEGRRLVLWEGKTVDR